MFILWGVLLLMALSAVLLLLIPLRHSHRPYCIVLLCALPLIAFLLYADWGASKALSRRIIFSDALQHPEAVLKRFHQYVKAYPNNPQAHYLLGKWYYAQGHYQLARLEAVKAQHLAPNHFQYAVFRIKNNFFVHHARLTRDEVTQLKALLGRDPYNVDAISLLALDSQVHQNYAAEEAYWRRLLALFPVGSRDEKMLLSQIARAQKCQVGAC